MEVAHLKFSLALQGSAVQAKEKVTEKPVDSLPGQARNMAHLQDHLVQQRSRVQNSEKSNHEGDPTKASRDDFLKVAQQVQEKLLAAGVNIHLEVDDDTDKIVMYIKDPKTDEVIRQIPPEEYLKVVESIKQLKPDLQLNGVEVDVKF